MEIPEYPKNIWRSYQETLMESVAETSEEFMDRYFGGEEFSVTEISAALQLIFMTEVLCLYVWEHL